MASTVSPSREGEEEKEEQVRLGGGREGGEVETLGVVEGEEGGEGEDRRLVA